MTEPTLYLDTTDNFDDKEMVAYLVTHEALVPVEPEHQHQWLPWLTLPNGSSMTQCTVCGERFQYDHPGVGGDDET